MTIIEQILISPVKPFLTLFKLSGGQYGYRGHIINFNQDISGLAQQLPHTNLSEIVIIRKPTDAVSAFSEFRVRRLKVQQALELLLRINSRYRNSITINQESLNSLPLDGSIHDQLTQIVVNDADEALDEDQGEHLENPDLIDVVPNTGAPNFVLPNMRQRVNEALRIEQTENDLNVLPMPELNPRPINELTPGICVLAFPCLFPTGKNSLKSNFNQNL